MKLYGPSQEQSGTPGTRRRAAPRGALAPLLASLHASTKHSSARNRLAVTMVAVEKDGVMAKVELACGDYRIVSLMSREAADELRLAPAYPLSQS